MHTQTHPPLAFSDVRFDLWDAGSIDTALVDTALLDAMSLEAAGDHLWRVCDCRVAVGQGRFMAFIEEKNDEFEVMQMVDDFVWTLFPSLRDALIHVLQTHPHSLVALDARESTWLK